MRENDIGNAEELGERVRELRLIYDNKARKGRIVFNLVFFSVLVGMVVAVIGFSVFRDSDIARNAAVVVGTAAVICNISFGEVIVFKLSWSLQSLQREIDALQRKIDPNRATNYAKKADEFPIGAGAKIRLAIGMSLCAVSTIVLLVILVISSIVPIELFAAVLIVGIWCVAVSFFVMFSQSVIRTIFYPTVSMLTIVGPPAFAMYLVGGMGGWAEVVCMIFSVVLGLGLFALFLYFTVYRPEKINEQFVKKNAKFFAERYLDETEIDVEITNAKHDRALLSQTLSTKYTLSVEKCTNLDPPQFEKLKATHFSEYHNAYYAAVKAIVKLYATPDGRAETTLKKFPKSTPYHDK